MHSTEFDEDWDVVVVGLGAAGCSAALSAHEGGARVLVIDKCGPETAGGNTRVSGGGWFINRNPERAAVFLRTLNGSRPVPTDVVDTWAQKTALNSEWLRDLGAKVAQSDAYHTSAEYEEYEGSDCYAGMDTIDGRMGHSLLYDFLVSAVKERRIEIRFNCRAQELITDGDGHVRGVRVDGPPDASSIRAEGGVVLATGGFAADPTMVQDHLRLDEYVLWGSPYSTGDGHRMARRVGADMWHMDNMMSITGIDVGDRTGLFLAPWAGTSFVFIGPDGRRLVDESRPNRHGHVLRNGHEEIFPLAPFFMIFDESMRTAGPLAPPEEVLPVGWKNLMENHRWSSDNSAELAEGRIQRADSIEKLASSIGVDPDTLQHSIRSYNAGCEAGRDDHFGRNPSTMTPISTGPFYAIRVVPLLGWSDGGPRRDGHARVVDTCGAVIDGLYVAGEASATYSWTKDGGFHIADALAFGRVAGAHAASRVGAGGVR